MPLIIDDPREWRVSMSGYSIKTGCGDNTRIVAKYPGAPSPLDVPRFMQWIEDAESICDLHNAALD